MAKSGQKLANVFASTKDNQVSAEETMNGIPSYFAGNIQGVLLDMLIGQVDKVEPAVLDESLLAWHKILQIGISKNDSTKVLGKNLTRRETGVGEEKLYHHERHQLLDSRCAKLGIQYGIMTFTSSDSFETRGGQVVIPGEEGHREMIRQVSAFVNRGWKDKTTGISWKCIYAQYHEEGFMIFVPKDCQVNTIQDLGLTISNDAKAMKYAKRIFAAHSGGMIEGAFVSEHDVPTGHVLTHRLNNGELVRTLVYDISLLSKDETSVVDGKILSNIKGFTNCALTVFGDFGLGKGIASPNDYVDYDIVIYGAKTRVRLSDDKSIYIGKISDVALHPLTMDPQTMVNAGFYELDLVPRLGIAHLDMLAKTLFSPGEYNVRELVSGLVRNQDSKWIPDAPDWPLIRALKLDIGVKIMPVLMRRLTNLVMAGSKDVSIGRVPMEGAGIRVYVRDNPAMTLPDGSVDLSLDKMFQDACEDEGLDNDSQIIPWVCIPDAPVGMVLIYRNPNTTSREMMIVYNYHYPELMEYVGQGWAFLGADAGAILSPLNGGDMDDNIGVIWDRAFLAKWKTMDYPVQERIEEQTEYVPLVTEHTVTNNRVWKEGSSTWNFKTFYDQLGTVLDFGVSLGTFINRGMLDSLLSGENKGIALKSLREGTFVKPENFDAPSLGDLDALLGQEILDVYQEYNPDLQGFVNMSINWLNERPDYMAAFAMTNSDKIIDWTVAHKGNKSIVDDLVKQAAVIEQTPVFPVSYAGRIPAKRKLAGNYLLVWTKQCLALKALRDYRDAVLAEVKRFEFLLAKPFPEVVNNRYPEDEGLQGMMKAVRVWWTKSLQSARVNGVLTSEGYAKVANGWDEKITKDELSGEDEMSETVIHHQGLLDLFTYQILDMGTNPVTLSDREWSSEIKVKLAFSWLNYVYTRKIDPDKVVLGQSYSDGVPNWMLNLVFDALEEMGITGQVEFLSLNYWAKKNLTEPVIIKSLKNGMCILKSNNRVITTRPTWTLPDGEYVMSPSGVVVVTESILELHSDWKPNQVKEIASGNFPASNQVDMFTITSWE